MPEDQDVNKFVTEQVRACWQQGAEVGREQTLGIVRVALLCAAFNSSLCLLPQKLEYTMGDSSDMPSRKELTSEELCKQMDKLLKENPNNQRIYDWIEVRVGTQCLSV